MAKINLRKPQKYQTDCSLSKYIRENDEINVNLCTHYTLHSQPSYCLTIQYHSLWFEMIRVRIQC